MSATIRSVATHRLHLYLAAGVRVLEVSHDDGEQAEELRAAGAMVTCVRPRGTAATLVARGFDVAELSDLTDRPGRYHGVDVAVATRQTCGSAWVTDDVAELLRALVPALAPGARLILSLPNPIHSMPGVSWLFGLARKHPRTGGPGGRGRRFPADVRLRSTVAAVERAGFGGLRTYAPLPDPTKPKFFVPLDQPAVGAYLFSDVVRPAATLAGQVGSRIAAALARRGCLSYLVPVWQIVADLQPFRPEAPSAPWARSTCCGDSRHQPRRARL